MFYLSKDFRFEASHQLPDHDGKCSRLHGHSWKMTVTVAGRNLQPEGGNNPKANMLADYADIKAIVGPFVDKYLDHHHLNHSLNERSPTSEVIAEWAFSMIDDRIKRDGLSNVSLFAIKIEETCTSACLYIPDGDKAVVWERVNVDV